MRGVLVFGILLFAGLPQKTNSKLKRTTLDGIVTDTFAFADANEGTLRVLVGQQPSISIDSSNNSFVERLKNVLSDSGLATSNERHDEFRSSVKYLSHVGIAVVEFAKSTPQYSISAAVDGFLNISEVSVVEPDIYLDVLESNHDSRFPASLTKCNTCDSPSAHSKEPSDKFWHGMWGLEDIGAEDAWKVYTGWTAGQQPIKVGIVDSGVDIVHEDLSMNMFVNEAELHGKAGEDDDENGYIDDIFGWNAVDDTLYPNDISGHGTHVAGTIGAVSNNQVGVTGVNWSPMLVPAKAVNDSGRAGLSELVTAIDYTLAVGCRVTNHSWSASSGPEVLQLAFQRTKNAGQLVVTSAGNSSKELGPSSPSYPASFGMTNMIVVAALDHPGDVLRGSSNYSPSIVHIAAPGQDIWSTLPKNDYGTKSGTSMATPYVAGAASLIWSLKPQLTYSEVKQIIKQTASPFTDSDDYVSWGKLNLADALRLVQTLPSSTPPPVETGERRIAIPPMWTCASGCTRYGMTCDEERTTTINTDLAACHRAMADYNSAVKLGMEVNSYWHPFGCHVTKGHYCYVNQQNFGLEEVGCLSAAVHATDSLRICVCSS